MIKSSKSDSVDDGSSYQCNLASPSGPQVSLRNTFNQYQPDSLVCSLDSEGMDSNFQKKSDHQQSIQLNTDTQQPENKKTLIKVNPLQRLQLLAAKNRLVKQFKQNLFMNSYILSKDYMSKILKLDPFLKNSNLSSLSEKSQNILIPVFEAYGITMRVWDGIVVFMYLIQLWVLPFFISFYRLDIQVQFLREFLAILSLLNMIVSLNREIFYKGDYITNRKTIIKLYFRNGVVGDTLQFITWLCFIFIKNNLEYQIYLFCLGIFLMFSTIIALQKRTEYYMDSYYNKGNLSNFLDLLVLILQIYYVAHYMACIWHFVGDIVTENGQISWITEYGFIDQPISTKYNYSFYWATMTMVTVGYGDLTGRNNYEILTSNIMMIFSSCIFAYSMNSIGIILKCMNDNQSNYRRTISCINSYMQKNEVDQLIQGKVRNYVKYLNQSEQQESKSEIKQRLSCLPSGLKKEMKENIAQKLIQKIKILQSNFSQQSLNKLIQVIKIQNYAPGESIFHQNEQQDCLCYINQGEVQINEENSQTQIQMIQKNSTFNEYSFFTNQLTKTSAISNGFTQIIKINRQSFLNILKENCQRDLEQFYNIKDTMLLNNDFSLLQKKCFYCGYVKHESINCPLITYQPNKNNLIRLTKKDSIPQKRRFFSRHYHYIPSRAKYLEIKNMVNYAREYYFSDQIQSDVDVNKALQPNIKDSINYFEYNQIELLTPDKNPREDTDVGPSKKSRLPSIQDGNTNLKRVSKFSLQQPPPPLLLEIKLPSKTQLDYFLPQIQDLVTDSYCNYERYMPHNNLVQILRQFQRFKRKTKISARKIKLIDSPKNIKGN